MKDVDVSALLRGFAKELRAFRFNGADTYVEQMDSLARKMERKASDIVHPSAITAERGVFIAGDFTVKTRNGAQRVRVERRRSRLAAA